MFRRGGQRDDRRRRVLTEDVVGRGHEDRKSAVDQQKCEGASYAPEAALENQLRLSDLVPQRLWGIGLFVLLGAAVVAGVLALYHHMEPWQTPNEAGRSLFDITASGSLASWIASVILLLTSLASIIVLSLRRHKLSDYNGRYRVWAWTAVATLALSAAATAPYHLVAAEALANLSGWQVPGGTATFWMAPSLLVLGVLAVRLLLDMRDSVLATFVMVISLLAYGGAIGMEISDPTSLVEPQTIMVLGGCKLAGHLFLLVSVLLFARHVLRDIQGLVVKRESRRAKQDDKEGTQEESTESRGKGVHKAHRSPPAPKGISDLESQTPSKRAKRNREAAEIAQQEFEEEEQRPSRRNNKKNRKRQEARDQEFDDYDEEPSGGGRKLTKAQRKKLRKLKAQQRQTCM